MSRCYVNVMDGPGYPFAEIVAGVKRYGMTPITGKVPVEGIEPSDVLLTWTLWRESTRYRRAELFRQAGAKVIVMENGWLPLINGARYWQAAFDGHNGAGTFPAGGPNRWQSWGIELAPWREPAPDDPILVCSQRGTVEDDPAITHGSWWAPQILAKLREHGGGRPIWWRPHPGAPKRGHPDSGMVMLDCRATPLADHLARAALCVVYSSSSATEALIRGVPVYYDGPNIMLREAAFHDPALIADPPRPDRFPAFERAAWAQWSAAELARGDMLAHLLRDQP